jgi:DNA-binding transcriptional regulator GbsR (MarR family)
MIYLFLVFQFLIANAVAEDTVVLAALARIGDPDNKDKTTVTTRDLQISLFLNENEPFLQEYQDKKDPLKDLIWEEMIYAEAKKLLNQDVTGGNIRDYITAFKKKRSADKMWTDLHVSDSELSEAVKRRLTARRLVQLKMGAKDLIFVSPEEIESYYVQNRNQLGQRSISEVRDKIRRGLQSLKSQERFRDWVNALTRSQGVVYYSGYKIQ